MSSRPVQPVYPIFLTHMAGAPVVMVGGGEVAARKVAGLLAVQAAVIVISPELSPELARWAEAHELIWRARPYRPGDLAGARLAFAATNQRAVNAMVADEAAQRGIPCNVADAPEEGTFHLPAVARQAEVVVAVGTSGTAPGHAKLLRDRIAAWLAENKQTGTPASWPRSPRHLPADEERLSP